MNSGLNQNPLCLMRFPSTHHLASGGENLSSCCCGVSMKKGMCFEI